MTKVADFSWARPGATALKNAGFTGVMRYFSYDFTGKNINEVELKEYIGAGLDVGVVWESTANRARSGKQAGIDDATAAKNQAKAIGYTGEIFFGIDYDASESDQPAINSYAQGFKSVVGYSNPYGGYWPLKRLQDAGLADKAWQTVAWSGSNRLDQAVLLQDATTALNGQVDNNQVLKSDFGQMGANSKVTPAPTATPATATGQTRTYVIQRGDTLSGLALRFGTTVYTLQQLNNIPDPNKINAGATIKVGGASVPAPAVSVNGQVYVVKPNDTLSAIALKYGLSVNAIAAANGIADPNKIYVNQTIRIPGTNAANGTATAPAPNVYIVQPNDTLSEIAVRFGTSVANLARINGIADPNKIYVNQHIRIF